MGALIVQHIALMDDGQLQDEGGKQKRCFFLMSGASERPTHWAVCTCYAGGMRLLWPCFFGGEPKLRDSTSSKDARNMAWTKCPRTARRRTENSTHESGIAATNLALACRISIVMYPEYEQPDGGAHTN